MAHVIAPQARLRLEVQFLGQRIVQIVFLAVHEGRYPHTWLDVRAPAVEMEIPAGMPAAAVGAVEADYVVILVFHPDAPEEAAFSGPFLWRYVKNQAAHFAEKLPAHIVELVMLLVEAVCIDENHLQEAVRQELHG